MDYALDAVILLGGLVIGAFGRGMAFKTKSDTTYVPRTECALCGKATAAALEGINGQLKTLLQLHTEEQHARHELGNKLQVISNVLYRIQGMLGEKPFTFKDGE